MTTDAKPKSLEDQLLSMWQWLFLQSSLRPAGGTRYRGSAHPKGDRSPGVCRFMRKTPRAVSYEQPRPTSKQVPFQWANPKRRRNAVCCGAKKVKHCCGVRGLPGEPA